MAASREPARGHSAEENNTEKYRKPQSERKKVVVVGLGMVGIAFMLGPYLPRCVHVLTSVDQQRKATQARCEPKRVQRSGHRRGASFGLQ